MWCDMLELDMTVNSVVLKVDYYVYDYDDDSNGSIFSTDNL